MIIAILPDSSSAETLLNNLSEADFDLKDVSVMMKDITLRNKIARDVGPLKGTQPAALSKALLKDGASPLQAQRCTDAIAQGKAVVVMRVDSKYESAAREMFQDASAEMP